MAQGILVVLLVVLRLGSGALGFTDPRAPEPTAPPPNGEGSGTGKGSPLGSLFQFSLRGPVPYRTAPLSIAGGSHLNVPYAVNVVHVHVLLSLITLVATRVESTACESHRNIQRSVKLIMNLLSDGQYTQQKSLTMRV